jgi:hypothetical protein
VDAAVSGCQAGDWLQELQLPLLEVVGPSDETVVAASWKWDQKVHPLQTDRDQEAMNIGEGLHMMSQLEFHYTATKRENYL